MKKNDIYEITIEDIGTDGEGMSVLMIPQIGRDVIEPLV